MPLTAVSASSSSHALPQDRIGYRRDVLPVFQARCARCHNPASPPDQPNWLSYKTALRYKSSILERVWITPDMPPDGNITPQEKTIIATWAKSSAPENAPVSASPSPGLMPAAPLTAEIPPPKLASGFLRYGYYLARAGDCLSCHTSAGGAPYAGGRAISTPYGILKTPNLTPDDDTGLGRWTKDDFYRAMHDGVSRDGHSLFPAFPYTFYTKMPRVDVNAIYAYLRTLTPVRNSVKVNQLRFPYDTQASLDVWRKLYFTPKEFETDPTRTPDWNRGKYLVEGPGHCSACHSPRNFMGAIKKSEAYSGADVDNWFASNLTSAIEYGIAEWSAQDTVDFLQKGATPEGETVVGPMAEVVFNSLIYLKHSDLRAMAVYLKSLPPKTHAEARDILEPTHLAQGRSLYVAHCASCHLSTGAGVPESYPPLTGNSIVNEFDPINLINVILEGIPARAGFDAMPAFSDPLSDSDIADLANYVRTRWENSASANATNKTVSEQRKALEGSHP